ncbi:MAG: AMP-binding enzyme, partial [Anaerolineae bacterium]
QPKDGATLTAQDVLAYCRSDLAPYKVPSQVRFVDEFELTPTGKIKKIPLQEMAIKELEQAAGTPVSASYASATPPSRGESGVQRPIERESAA